MKNLKLMKKPLLTAALLGALTLVGAAQAGGMVDLEARDLDGNPANGPEAFYDTALNITWLRAASTDKMDWSTANAWAGQERFDLSGWRLPTTHVTTADGSCDWSDIGSTSCGYNPVSTANQGSEMAHLFFESLGNKSFYAPGTTDEQADWGLKNAGEFENMQSLFYWSGTKYAPDSDQAWYFSVDDGFQDAGGKFNTLYALAVRPGDVTAAVPEPQTWALALIGLAGVLLARRRRVL
jgi:MYXO-CTERM domain-containing protein